MPDVNEVLVADLVAAVQGLLEEVRERAASLTYEPPSLPGT
jgi:hypothetical protein